MNKFEIYIREKLLRQETALDTEDLWAAIEQKRRRRRLLLWLQFGVGLSLPMLCIGAFFHFKSTDNQGFNVNDAEQTTATTIQVAADKNTSVLGIKQEANLTQNIEATRDVKTKFDVINQDKKAFVFNKYSKDEKQKAFENKSFVNELNINNKAQYHDNQGVANESNTPIEQLSMLEKPAQPELETKMDTQKIVQLLSPLTNTFDIQLLPVLGNKDISFKKISIIPKATKHYELFFVIGGGVPNRAINPQKKEIFGTTKAIEYWSASVSAQRTLKHHFFVTAGFQANRIINRLDWQGALVSNIKYPDSLRFIALNPQGLAYIAKGDYDIIRTTQRNVRQYQYLDNYNLSLGVGKEWNKKSFRLQLGADLLLGINKVKGTVLNQQGTLQDIGYQRFIASSNMYAQCNIPFRNLNMLWVRANYWQSLTYLDNAKYNSLSFQLGCSKQF